MLITREQLEKIVNEYDKDKSAKEVLAFMDGIDACLELFKKLSKPVDDRFRLN
jgi:hypothetical protein